MRLLFAVLGFVLAAVIAPQSAFALVDIQVDLSSQTMTVRSETGETHVWPISSARRGYVTPRGTYKPERLARMHYSRKYHMSPMPHSIFFRGGYAIHGTNEARNLGRPASHGCVRLAKANAAQLFAMVQKEGATIRIDGTPQYRSTMVASAKRKHDTRMAQKQRKAPAKAQPDLGPALGYAPAPEPATFFGLKLR